MTINNSSDNPVEVPYGNAENINVNASGQCWGDTYQYNQETNTWEPIGPELGLFVHDFDFGDGTWHRHTNGGGNPDRLELYTHSAPGLYTVSDSISCECAYGTVAWDFLGTAHQDVWVEDPSPPPCDPGSTYAALYNAFQTRSPSIVDQYGMTAVGSTFSFGFLAAIQNATVGEQNAFLSGGMVWTMNAASCGVYSCLSNIQATSQNPDVDVLLVNSLPAPGGCGSNRWVGEAGLIRDEIRLLKAGLDSGCDSHRVETAYHEIGHLLGFAHLPLPGGTPISAADLYHSPRPFGPGPRPIQGHHLRILVEKY